MDVMGLPPEVSPRRQSETMDARSACLWALLDCIRACTAAAEAFPDVAEASPSGEPAGSAGTALICAPPRAVWWPAGRSRTSGG